MPTASATTLSDPPHWSIHGSRADAIGQSGQIDLAQVAKGLVFAGGAQALGIDLPSACRPTEAWARGRDLTAIYEPSDSRQLRITAMWRAIPQPADTTGVAIWELILSAQTSLLETVASVDMLAEAAGSVTFGHWNGDQVRWRNAEDKELTRCLWIWPTPESGPHRMASSKPDAGKPAPGLLLAIHPLDAGSLNCSSGPDGRVAIRCRLFPRDVEKGVLLRSRVLAATGPVDLDWNADWVAPVLAGFSRSPLVLNT